LPIGTSIPTWQPDARKVPPGLHFVATPIGAARDITLHALDLLAGADVLAAEDTRTLRHLMEIHGIPLGNRPLIAFHDHNWEAARPKLMRALTDGKSVAYASEAGTPLVADPGYQLSRAAIDAGVPVIAAPGASAVLCALMVSGLPSDRFLFAGFAPATAKARRDALAELAPLQATVILYESPKRLLALLAAIITSHGPDRPIVVCRELTKKFEEVLRGPAADIAARLAGRDIKGEIAVLIDRAPPAAAGQDEIAAALKSALATLSLKDAAADVARRYSIPKRDAYQMALRLTGQE
jgi:16S rRNA (cytidine1402-2'-O)-methyltransferase